MHGEAGCCAVLKTIAPQSNMDTAGNREGSFLCQPLVEAGPEWQAALERNELALLQRHILGYLSQPDCVAGGACWPIDELSKTIMLAWARANTQQLCPELQSLPSGAHFLFGTLLFIHNRTSRAVLVEW